MRKKQHQYTSYPAI